MTSAGVVLNHYPWVKKIKDPKIYIRKKLLKLNKLKLFQNKSKNFTIFLTNNKTMKELNKKFRNKNKPTDILSFPFEKKINIKKSSYLGDIVISYEFVDKPKKLNNLEFKDKVIKIFIHGFLHLLGYDHIKLKDFKKMLKEEEEIYRFIKPKITKLV